MQKIGKWFVSIGFGIVLSACVATSDEQSVGKGDFAQLTQWTEEVNVLEQHVAAQQPRTEFEALSLLDGLFSQAIYRAKSLTLQHRDVVALRDKLVQALQYQHQLMRAMVSPKYANENVDVLSLKAEKLAQEIEMLYDKLDASLGQ